jgi:hypothetical protein
MSDSGAPSHWPFNMFDPVSFKCPERRVTRVFLHCSAWDGKVIGQKLAETINEWHLANGWAGVGYHFVVDHMGGICTARSLSVTPAAQLGKDGKGNIETIAIMTNGLWDFTADALRSTYVLCQAIDDAYKLANKPVTFHGHCEIDPKPCPVYDYQALLGLVDGKFNACTPHSAEDVVKLVQEKAASQWHHT